MILFVVACLFVCGYSLPVARDSANFTIFEIPEQIIANGYQSERHNVITEDGYILEMHRIPFGRNQNSSQVARPSVFLMHGLLGASNSFIHLGPEYSIAYNLADVGFDVWMGNHRGTRLSRRHVSLDPDDDVEKFEFFDFSWEEVGMIDVPAMVDYILEFNGQEKLHYIGHSQGGTVFLVLASMRPEYNEKFTSVHLLAGVGYMEYFPNDELRSAAAMTDIIYGAALYNGFVEVFPPDIDEDFETTNATRADRCTGHVATMHLCETIGIKHLVRETEEEDEDDLLSILDVFGDGEDMGGGALKQIAHYGQNIRDRQFRRWNYGLFQNLINYGRISPPSYDLSLITSHVTMHYTVNDNLLDERDVLAMAADMPNVVVRKVARETFLHEDFAVAEDVKELVTDFMIEAMLALEDSENIDEDIDTEEDIDAEEETDGEEDTDATDVTDIGVEEDIDPIDFTTAAPVLVDIEDDRTDGAFTSKSSLIVIILTFSMYWVVS